MTHAAEGGQIRRMEASGPVRITQKAQCAVGDRADFDMRTNTATLSGNVVARRSHDVVRGDRMVIDLSTGLTRMEGRQVDAMFNVNSKSAPGGC